MQSNTDSPLYNGYWRLLGLYFRFTGSRSVEQASSAAAVSGAWRRARAGGSQLCCSPELKVLAPMVTGWRLCSCGIPVQSCELPGGTLPLRLESLRIGDWCLGPFTAFYHVQVWGGHRVG